MASGMLIPRLQHERRGRIALVIAPLLLLAIIAVAHGDEIEGGGRGERVEYGESSDNADAERSSFSEAVSESIVIVGGGPAGASLASGLVDRGISVLLIEQGEADSGSDRPCKHLGTWAVAACGGGSGKASMWYETEAQGRLGKRRIMAFRGRGGGGSSNVNAGIWMRGRREDYEGWGDVWGIEDIERSFVEAESKVVLNPVHASGPGASLVKIMDESKVTRTAASVGDWSNEGTVSPFMATHENMERQTPWRGMVSGRRGIRVMDRTRVEKVMIEEGRAVGLRVMRDGVRGEVLLGQGGEVVLCAGTFETPKLLMLSGIGPRSHLESFGIPITVGADAVGKHLQDHVAFPIISASRKRLSRNDTNGHGVHGLVNLRSKKGDYQLMLQDTSWVPYIAPHLAASILVPTDNRIASWLRSVTRFAVSALLKLPPVNWLLRQTTCVQICLMTPRSEGHVKLASRNPASPPLIHPAYLSHEDDLKCLAEALDLFRACQRGSAEAKETQGFEILPGPICNRGSTKRGLERWARHFSFSYFHPVGTCRMGTDPSESVVDQNLRVYGVQNLRIADASIAPRVPSAPTMAMCCMIGTRAASLLSKPP